MTTGTSGTTFDNYREEKWRRKERESKPEQVARIS
jgi:hypothetical protein